MTVFSIIMTATWLLAGAGVLVIGIKAGQGTLHKNSLVGIRTPEMLASDEAWLKGHKAAANYLKISSIPLFIGGAACLVASDSLIGWISMPVVVLLVGMVLLASRKAHVAIK